ncbi:MAG: hypothetical protein U1F61_27795 [Opitutaceae bacterium]
MVTSLPDLSETRFDLETWKAWFEEAAKLCISITPAEGAALFFQSDIRHAGVWIDKGSLVQRAAESAGAAVLFHKIVCRFQPGRVTAHRPGYTHLIAVSRALRSDGEPGIPDVIVDAGRLPWVRAMGMRAAAHAVRFARDQAGARTIIDPFCGVGTVLAVANTLGLDATGVELSPRRAEQARHLTATHSEL